MAARLTRLQQVILRLEQLHLPRRDAVRMATAEVGFFVGQDRYEDELRKAQAILADDEEPTTQEAAS